MLEEIKIENIIYEIRGKEVMLDSDLAELYKVETKRINEAVKNNLEKFPERFSWKLDDKEYSNLRSKISTSSLERNYGGRRNNPRVFTEQGVAIRMEGNKIGEIRGVASNQNLEPEMEEVVEEKIKDFPDKEEYYKKVSDMKMLTQIYKKHQNNIELTKEELKFIYEMDDVIIGFGYGTYPRIVEIMDVRDQRKIRKELAYIFDCMDDKISFDEDEITNDTVYHYGNLEYRFLISAEELILPQHVGGYLDLESLENSKNLVLPKSVGSFLDLRNLFICKNLILPQKVGGNLCLNHLRTAEGLVLPEIIGGDLYLDDLIGVEGLKLPKKIKGGLFFDSLKSTEGLIIPEPLTYTIYMDGFTITPKNVHEYRNNKEIKSVK